MTSFDRSVLRRPPAPAAPSVLSGSVTRCDSTGVWVTATGADENHPSGPCRGATRPLLIPVGTTVTLGRELLPRGTRVAYVLTADGPWILNWE